MILLRAADPSPWAFVIVLAAGVSALVLYLLPAIVALSSHHHNAGAIAALNILLGWTVLGWVVAFVWSFTSPPPPSIHWPAPPPVPARRIPPKR